MRLCLFQCYHYAAEKRCQLQWSVSLHSLHARTYPNPHTVHYVILLSACGGLRVYVQMPFCFNSILNKHDGPNGKRERGRERERLRTTQCWSGSTIQYKAGVTLLSTLMVQSGNKLQGCPELYRNLLLTAESHTGLLYSYNTPTHKPAPNTARHLVLPWLEAEYHPFLSVKHINSLSVARKGELILQHMWIKKGKSEEWKKKERKLRGEWYSTEERKGKGQGKGIERGRGTEREILLKNEVTESFVRAGRVARQFSNVWDFSFAGLRSHFIRWQMLNLFWAHQGPLGRLLVFAWNINVAWDEDTGKK